VSRKKLRVVTMVDRLMTSGGEIVATRVAMELDQRRFESILCSTRPSAARHVRAAESAGVRVLSLDRRSRLDVGQWAPLVRLLRSERVEIMHAHKHGSNVWASLLGRLAGVSVVIAHEHSWSHVGEPLRKMLDQHLVTPAVDVVLGTSREHWRQMIDTQGIDRDKARYVVNGIPPLRDGDGSAVRRELNIPDESPVIGTVCTLRPEKAVDVLVEAAAVLVRDAPGLTVLIAGDGPERSRLEKLVEERGLTSNVRFLGYWSPDALPDLLAAFDVAVSSSDFDATPLSVLEFMAAGLPIVATRVGGVPGVIEDGVQGWLVPPREPPRLARAVAELLASPKRRRELGRNARERQRAEFDIGVMVRKLEDLYECLYWSSPRGHRARSFADEGRWSDPSTPP
jgi:glycosyltransferase involved in cell wall biosynthesis